MVFFVKIVLHVLLAYIVLSSRPNLQFQMAISIIHYILTVGLA